MLNMTLAKVFKHVKPQLYYLCNFADMTLDISVAYYRWDMADRGAGKRVGMWEAISGLNAVYERWELVMSNSQLIKIEEV